MITQKDPENKEGRILNQFIDFKDKRVLEIGCGEGRLTWKYAAASSITIGVDSDHTALRVAQADIPHNLQQNVHFGAANATHLPFAKETFDIAILAWSL